MNNNLKSFLIESKKQTYANSNIKKESPSRLSSNDYHYEKKIDGQNFAYHDTYFGGTKFMGEEVVYCNDSMPEWGMNYYGVTLDEALNEDVMDKVLRPALMKVGEDDSILPVRGPRTFANDGYIYTFEVVATLDCFEGSEKIYKEDKLIYQLTCHGGVIRK